MVSRESMSVEQIWKPACVIHFHLCFEEANITNTLFGETLKRGGHPDRGGGKACGRPYFILDF